MARTEKTNNFIDMDFDIGELGNDIDLFSTGGDNDLLGLDELDMDLGLGLDDSFGNYNDIASLCMDVVPMEESVSKLESILDMNNAYNTSTQHVSDRGKNERGKRAVEKIISKIRTPENTKLILSDHSKVNKLISSHMNECYRAIESGTQVQSSLSRKLMKLGIKFDSDAEVKEVDDIVSRFINETSLKIDERNRELVLRNIGGAKIDLTNMHEVQLVYINNMRFVPSTGKLFVTCPNCGVEYEHKIVESSRVMSEVVKTGIPIKHNPLFCECGSVSILKDEIIDDISMRVKDKIRSFPSDDDRATRIATIDMSVLNNIPFLTVDGDVEVSEISQQDCLNFLRMQQQHIAGYNKSFYKRYLCNPRNKQDRYSILDRGSFEKLDSSYETEKESVIGCIYGSPYFSILRELDRKKDMANLYMIEYNKLNKIIEYISRDKAVRGEESIEFNYAIEAVNASLHRLGLAKNSKLLDESNLSIDVLNKLKSIIKDKLSGYVDMYNKCIKSKSELVSYLCKESATLFRFTPVKHIGDVLDYYKVFETVEEAESLINAVAPIVSRCNWTIRSMKSLTYLLGSRSRCKVKASDPYSEVVKSLEKYIDISDERDEFAFTLSDSIVKMPKELIRLTNDIESQNYYRFIYNIIALSKVSISGSTLLKAINKEIHNVPVSEDELRVYNMYKDIDKFEQHMSLLALGFSEDEITNYLATSSFNCRAMKVRKGNMSLEEYVSNLNELRPHTPDKCILDLFNYKYLVSHIYLVNSINNMLNVFKDYHELVLQRVVAYVDSQYINVATTDLLTDLQKYDKLDLSGKLCYDIDLDILKANEVYKCIVEHTPIYTRMLADNVDDESSNKGTVEKDTFAKLLRVELDLSDDTEYYLNLYTIMNVVEDNTTLIDMDKLVPVEYRNVFRKFFSVFDKRKYSEEYTSVYGYDVNTFNKLKDEFNQLLNTIADVSGPVKFDALKQKLDVSII